MKKGFLYEQRSGNLYVVNGDYKCPLGTFPAGAEGYICDPEAQDLRGKGPIPRGQYSIRGVPHHRFASPALRLDPHEENEMHGRAGFFIHGGTKSEGCILVQLFDRQAIASLVVAGFGTLTVER